MRNDPAPCTSIANNRTSLLLLSDSSSPRGMPWRSPPLIPPQRHKADNDNVNNDTRDGRTTSRRQRPISVTAVPTASPVVVLLIDNATIRRPFELTAREDKDEENVEVEDDQSKGIARQSRGHHALPSFFLSPPLSLSYCSHEVHLPVYN